eukprot:6172274-Pleurochrysis_carterae.AAC.2
MRLEHTCLYLAAGSLTSPTIGLAACMRSGACDCLWWCARSFSCLFAQPPLAPSYKLRCVLNAPLERRLDCRLYCEPAYCLVVLRTADPHEQEILFAPLTGCEVVNTRVENTILVVEVRLARATQLLALSPLYFERHSYTTLVGSRGKYTT